MTIDEEFPDFPVQGNAVIAEPWTEKQDAAFKAWLLKNYWSGPRWVKVRFNFEIACGACQKPVSFEHYAQVKKTAFLAGRFPTGAQG